MVVRRYDRPLQHLEAYARELAANQGEGYSSAMSETETETASMATDSVSVTGSGIDQLTTDLSGDDSAAAGKGGTAAGKVGRRGMDNISRKYDRAVKTLGQYVMYVQAKDATKQAHPQLALRQSLLQVLPHDREVDELLDRGLRPVELGSTLVGSVAISGTTQQDRKIYVMSIRMVKYYMDVRSKPELRAMMEAVRSEYQADRTRRGAVRTRKREIEGEIQYPKFQRALTTLLQNEELPDEAQLRMDLRRNIEITLTDIYSQAVPNTERFDSLVAEASSGVAKELKAVSCRGVLLCERACFRVLAPTC